MTPIPTTPTVDPQIMRRAAEGLAGVLAGLAPAHLNRPTPCAVYDVRALLNHLLFWGPSLVAAATKQSVPPPASAETDVDLTDGWATALPAHLERTVEAWTRPDAWQGSTTMGGPMEIPAATAGGMLLGELVIHGWDLARASDQEPAWDESLLVAVHEVTVATADLGRQMGIYGPVIDVPASAPSLHRTLGLVGRDPSWSPESG